MRAVLSLFFLLSLTCFSLSAAEATGTVIVKKTPVSSAPDDQSTVGHMALTKNYSGAITGTGTGHMLMVRTATEGSAGYVAIEKVEGSLDGNSGSFLLQHHGIMDRGKPSLSITVVPDSATGQLVGLSGAMTLNNQDETHHYTLSYTLPAKE